MLGNKVLLAAALSLVLGGTALAQDRDPHHTGNQDRARSTVWSRQDSRDRAPEQSRPARPTVQKPQPVRDRDRDRERNDRDDRYRSNGAYYPNGGYYPYVGYPNGVYGDYGNRGQAQQIGYQDGLSDGSRDRATGHSYRPQEDLNYRLHHGSNYGAGYDQAYMQGYQRGWSMQSGVRWPY